MVHRYLYVSLCDEKCDVDNKRQAPVKFDPALSEENRRGMGEKTRRGKDSASKTRLKIVEKIRPGRWLINTETKKLSNAGLSGIPSHAVSAHRCLRATVIFDDPVPDSQPPSQPLIPDGFQVIGRAHRVLDAPSPLRQGRTSG